MTLTNKHIETIRQFLFAETVTERVRLREQADSPAMAVFMDQLREYFVDADKNETDLQVLAASLEANDQISSLLQLQQEYYAYLADLHAAGLTNSDLEKMLASNHKGLLAEIEFSNELKTAFKLQERAALKNQFSAMEDDKDLSIDEISMAYRIQERRDLKKEFADIEANFKSSKHIAPVIPFNWRQLAVAASVIGLILTATFYLFDKKPGQADQPVAVNHDKPVKGNNRDNQLLAEKQLADFMTTIIPESKQTTAVKEEMSLGYAPKKDSLKVKIYDLGVALKKIDSAINMSKKENPGEQKILELLTKRRDSISSLNNKYRFVKDSLYLYCIARPSIEVYKLKGTYYLKNGHKIYSFEPSPTLKILSPANPEAIDKLNESIME